MVEIKSFNKELYEKLFNMHLEYHFSNKCDPLYKSLISNHKTQLELIIDKYGWPNHNLVKWGGQFAVYLIKEYYSPKTEFYKKCVKLLEESVNNNETPKNQLEYLLN